MPQMLVYGNSYAQGQGASDPALRFSTLAATVLGLTEVNNAVGGEQTYETLTHVYQDPAGGRTFDGSALDADVVVFASVVNDSRLRGNTGDGYATTGTSLAALLALFSGGVRTDQSAFVESGPGWASWAPTPGVFTPSGGSARKSSTNGDSFTVTAVGDVVTIFGVGYAVGTTLGVEYRVDGALVRSREYGSLVNARTPAVFPIYSEQITGMGDRSHAVNVKKVSGTGNLFADSAVAPAANPPRVVIVPALRLPATSYGMYAPFNNGSDATLALYNQLVAGVARRFANVRIAKVQAWDPAAMVSADGVHPNDLGHQTIADAVVAAVPAGSSLRRNFKGGGVGGRGGA